MTGSMNRFITLCMVVVFITACASTGVLPIGNNKFMVSKQTATGFESAVGIKGDVLREANSYCVKSNKELEIISLKTKDGVPGKSYATAEVIFSCK
jgi:hypothetical protein